MTTANLFVRQHQRISWSTCLALTVHLIAIAAIGLTLDSSPRRLERSLEITLSHRQSEQRPEHADFVAQHDQQGSGTLEEVRELTTTDHAARGDQGRDERNESAANSPTSSAYPGPTQATQTAADQAQSERTKAGASGTGQQGESIDQIQAKLDRQRQAYSRRPKVHRLTSAATQQAVDAAYQLAWQQRVEQFGNQHYPKQASQRQLSGDVRLAVSLWPDGKIKSIDILSSSGLAVLDRAAIRSVKLAEPFEPFPPELRRKADILEIIRTWQFRNDVMRSR